jgi:hypothetical protein
MTMSEPEWKAQICWDDSNRATYQGETFELWSHSYETGTSRKAWHLHAVLRDDQPQEEPLSGPLCITRREAARLAELWILGWRPEPGNLDMWQAPDEQLHPVVDVLTGVIPH